MFPTSAETPALALRMRASRFLPPERDVVESQEEDSAFHGRCAAFRSLIAAADDLDRVTVITRRSSVA